LEEASLEEDQREIGASRFPFFRYCFPLSALLLASLLLFMDLNAFFISVLLVSGNTFGERFVLGLVLLGSILPNFC
jgi:hypothetical protein